MRIRHPPPVHLPRLEQNRQHLRVPLPLPVLPRAEKPKLRPRKPGVVEDESELGDEVAVAGGEFAVGVEGPEDGDGGAVGGEGVCLGVVGGFVAGGGEGGGDGGAAGMLVGRVGGEGASF